MLNPALLRLTEEYEEWPQAFTGPFAEEDEVLRQLLIRILSSLLKYRFLITLPKPTKRISR